MGNRLQAPAILLAALVIGPVTAGAAAQPNMVRVEPLPPGTQTRPVQLSRMVVEIAPGTQTGRVRAGLLCVSAGNVPWQGRGSQNITNAQFDNAFRQEMQRLGYTVVGASNSLFGEAPRTDADHVIGGRVTSLYLDICYPHSGLGNTTRSKGSARIGVTWEIYSRPEGRVIATVVTQGAFEQRRSQDGGSHDIPLNAFANAVRWLAASQEFRRVFIGPPTDAGEAPQPRRRRR